MAPWSARIGLERPAELACRARTAEAAEAVVPAAARISCRPLFRARTSSEVSGVAAERVALVVAAATQDRPEAAHSESSSSDLPPWCLTTRSCVAQVAPEVEAVLVQWVLRAGRAARGGWARSLAPATRVAEVMAEQVAMARAVEVEVAARALASTPPEPDRHRP